MDPVERARQLAEDIKNSPEYNEFHRQKELLKDDAAIMALLNEYGKMQMNIQLKVASGQNPENDEVQRFNQLSSLLFADERTSSYILAQMRMQKLTADILQIIGNAAELDENLPL